MTGTRSFGPGRRLSDKSAFDRVFSAPDFRLRRHPFMLLARLREQGDSRIGFVVGKKHARRAVVRNRIRRLARERFRGIDFPQPVDIILMARPGAADCDRLHLSMALAWLFDRLLAEVASPTGAARPERDSRRRESRERQA